MSKTWRVKTDHPAFIDWAREHDLEPTLMNRTVVVGDDGTVLLDKFRIRDDDQGQPYFVTIPGTQRHMLQPIRITPTRALPDEVLEEPMPPTPPDLNRSQIRRAQIRKAG